MLIKNYHYLLTDNFSVQNIAKTDMPISGNYKSLTYLFQIDKEKSL